MYLLSCPIWCEQAFKWKHSRMLFCFDHWLDDVVCMWSVWSPISSAMYGIYTRICTGYCRSPTEYEAPTGRKWNISNDDVCQSRELYIHQTIMFANEKIMLSKWLSWIGGPIELTKVRNNKSSRSFTRYLYPGIYIYIWCTSLPCSTLTVHQGRQRSYICVNILTYERYILVSV